MVILDVGPPDHVQEVLILEEERLILVKEIVYVDLVFMDIRCVCHEDLPSQTHDGISKNDSIDR